MLEGLKDYMTYSIQLGKVGGIVEAIGMGIAEGTTYGVISTFLAHNPELGLGLAVGTPIIRGSTAVASYV
jgi:hypothetical protein